MCKDLAARKNHSTQNALTGLHGVCAKTAEQNTEGRQKKQNPLYLANSIEPLIVQMPTRKSYARGDATAYAQKPTPPTRTANYMQFPVGINPSI